MILSENFSADTGFDLHLMGKQPSRPAPVEWHGARLHPVPGAAWCRCLRQNMLGEGERTVASAEVLFRRPVPGTLAGDGMCGCRIGWPTGEPSRVSCVPSAFRLRVLPSPCSAVSESCRLRVPPPSCPISVPLLSAPFGSVRLRSVPDTPRNE